MLPAITLEYGIENATALASKVTEMFDRESIDKAVREAVDEQVELEETGRIQIFIPCNTESLKPHIFEELLFDVSSHQLKNGELPAESSIYGRRNAAFLGTTESGRPHNGFLVYDSAVALIVDLINREGKSLMNKFARKEYLSSLEKSLGYSVAWQERKLSEN